MEPTLRKLKLHYGDALVLRPVMGGLVEDINEYHDEHNHIGGSDYQATNRQIAEHWVVASRKHGMPVDSINFGFFSSECRSTFPMCLAYKAVELIAPDKAESYLYRLRWACALEAEPSGTEAFLVELAGSLGIDHDAFRLAMTDGRAGEAFQRDLRETREMKVETFPTFRLDYGEKQLVLPHFETFDGFVKLIDELTNGAIEPQAPRGTSIELLQLLFGEEERLTEAEVRTALSLEEQEAYSSFISPLIEGGDIERLPLGNGYILRRLKF